MTGPPSHDHPSRRSRTHGRGQRILPITTWHVRLETYCVSLSTCTKKSTVPFLTFLRPGFHCSTTTISFFIFPEGIHDFQRKSSQSTTKPVWVTLPTLLLNSQLTSELYSVACHTLLVLWVLLYFGLLLLVPLESDVTVLMSLSSLF